MLDHDLGYLIFDHLIRRTACPDCGANAGLPCRTMSGGRMGMDCTYYHQGRIGQARRINKDVSGVFESQTCERCGRNLKFHHMFGESQRHVCDPIEDGTETDTRTIRDPVPPKFIEAIARGKAILEEQCAEPPDRISALESRLEARMTRMEASLEAFLRRLPAEKAS